MERFVVGTGRCGSTLLSRLLAEHRDVVSLHEFFTGLDGSRRFRTGPVEADEVATLLASEQPVTTQVLALGYTSDEIQYPFDAPGARFRRGDPVPWLLVTMLSRLSATPDALFDDFVERAHTLPTQTMAEHYRELFGWLTGRAGGSTWVERSGSSIDYLGSLIDLYPRARFVHIHRDGPEAALSIRAHPFYRLALAILFDLFPADGTEEEQVRAAIATPPPVGAAGRFWSDQVLHGYEHVGRLDDDQWLEIRFEDLVATPGATLERIAGFLALPDDPDFTDRAGALVEEAPRPRVTELSAEDRATLAEACRPAMILLGRADG